MTKKRFLATVLAGLLCLMAVAAMTPQDATISATAYADGAADTGNTGGTDTTVDPEPSESADPPRRGSADNPFRIRFPKHTNTEISYLRHLYNCMIAYSGTTGYPPREGTQYFKDANTGASFVAVWTDYGGVTITQQ